jgi:hypothetical protein
VTTSHPNRGARQKSIALDSPAEWKAALQGIKHAFAHTWENCYAMHLTTGFTTYLYSFEDGSARIVCPIAEREFEGHVDIVTPYGFSGFVGNGNCPEFLLHWHQFVKERGYVCGYIALNPIFATDTYFNSSEIYRSNTLYFLDLTRGTDELWSNLDRNRKRELKGFDKIGFILNRNALTNFFVENYPEFLRRVQASPASYFNRRTLTSLCNLSNVVIVGAGALGKIEAVYIFGHTPYAGDCLFNVAVPEGRHHATSLLWWGVNYLKSNHVPLLNLGGGVQENDSIARSKERFGSLQLPFRALKQVYNEEIYKELCLRRGADPADKTGYFPAYRSPAPPD